MGSGRESEIRKREIEYFGAFFEASHALLTSASLKQVLKLLVRRAVRVLRVKAASLRLLDERTNRLELVSSHLLSKRYLKKGPLNADRSIPEVLKGNTVLIRDARKDPRVQYREEKIDEGIHSILSVPVVAGKQVIGVLRLYTSAPRDFSGGEIEFVSALAAIGGLAIANARIYEKEGVKLSSLLNKVGTDLPNEAKKGKRRLKSFALPSVDPGRSLELFREFRDLTAALLSSLDSQKVIELILSKMQDLMKSKGCSLRLINETTRELELVSSRGLSDAFLEKGPVHADQSISEALQGEPVFIADAKTDPRIEYPAEMAKEGISTILSVPITAQDRVIGVLRLYSAEPRQYGRDEAAFLSAVAEIAGVVIVNAKLYEQTKYDLSFWKTTVAYLTR